MNTLIIGFIVMRAWKGNIVIKERKSIFEMHFLTLRNGPRHLESSPNCDSNRAYEETIQMETG